MAFFFTTIKVIGIISTDWIDNLHGVPQSISYSASLINSLKSYVIYNNPDI